VWNEHEREKKNSESGVQTEKKEKKRREKSL